MKKTVALLILFFVAQVSFSQTTQPDNRRKYESGKQLLKEEKYALAQEVFRPLLTESPDNPFAAYARYYHSLAFFKLGKPDEARLGLLQLLEKQPNWPDADNANYLLANIAFDKKEFIGAIGLLEKIRSKPVKEAGEKLKLHYLGNTKNIGLLKTLQQKYPEDRLVAELLVDKLTGSVDPDDLKLASELNARYKFNRTQQIAEQTKSEKKDAYNVAVLLPFNYNQLVSDKSARGSQIAVDMYNGMQMAREQLAKEGIKINLLAYDAGNDAAQVQKLISQPDFAATDLIVGPLYGNPIKAILPFANERKIGQINPITNNGQMLASNPVAYLFQPSIESQARQAATYALQNFTVKTAMIFYTAAPKDSLLAHAYRQKFTEGGGKVLAFKKITPATVSQLAASVTGMDETRLGHVFIPASNQNIAINVMSTLDKVFAKYPVLAMADWLQYPMINFEQYELRNAHFIFPEFIDYRKPEVIAFKQAYTGKRNLIPSVYAYQGYELLMQFGRALAEFGTNFHAGLQSQPPRPGALLPGFNYQNSNDNQYVPLIKFQNADLVLVNPVATK